MSNIKKYPVGTAFLFGIFLIIMFATYFLTQPSAPPQELNGVLRQDFKLLHPFELTDHNNTAFNQQNLQDKWTFVFFGYTSCPDICPTTLHVLSSVQTLLDAESNNDSNNRQIVFISVDPERDTTEALADYMPYFNNKFIGVTGSKAELEKLSRQFGAGYVLEPETAPGQYLVSHTSAIFLVDPSGRLVASFSQPHYPATIAAQYEKIQAYFLSN